MSHKLKKLGPIPSLASDSDEREQYLQTVENTMTPVSPVALPIGNKVNIMETNTTAQQ